MSEHDSQVGTSTPLRSDQICQHDGEFVLHVFKTKSPLPGAWFCESCPYWLNFDPKWAGKTRPKVLKDMPWVDYNEGHWTSFVLGYTKETKFTKVWKASKTSPG